MSPATHRIRALATLVALALICGPRAAMGQHSARLFPDRSLMPTLLAGARDPGVSASLLAVTRNPNQNGNGVEAEVSLGTTIPLLLVAGESTRNPVVVGVEAAVFGRFGLQVLERELIASDWLFAIPLIWHRENGWMRLRYYHSSSHMGDEYTRRFGDPGINFARDAAELLVFYRPLPALGVYAGTRFAVNVHPEESKRWVVRTGGQIEAREKGGAFLPFAAADVEWDEEAGGRPRVEVRVGAWIPKVGSRRVLRFSLSLLTGPSPLGQFHGLSTTQFGMSFHGSL